MIFDIWMPHHSDPMAPLSIVVNFILDGAIYLLCLFLYHSYPPNEKQEISAFKSDLRSAWKRHLAAIIFHVVIGYVIDFFIYVNVEQVIIKSGYSVTSLLDVLFVWGIYFLFLTICQGLALCITCHHRSTRYKINLILGSILFGLATNPMNLTLPYYLDYWL